MDSSKDSQRNIRSFPYWPRLLTQDPLMIAGGQMVDMIGDISINRIPGQTDFESRDIRVGMSPQITQGVSDARLTQGFNPIYGKSDAGGLFAMMLDSIPNPQDGK